MLRYFLFHFDELIEEDSNPHLHKNNFSPVQIQLKCEKINHFMLFIKMFIHSCVNYC
jgi:hypothetical protein